MAVLIFCSGLNQHQRVFVCFYLIFLSLFFQIIGNIFKAVKKIFEKLIFCLFFFFYETSLKLVKKRVEKLIFCLSFFLIWNIFKTVKLITSKFYSNWFHVSINGYFIQLFSHNLCGCFNHISPMYHNEITQALYYENELIDNMLNQILHWK